MSMSNEVGDFQTAQTLETFGFLPKLTQEEVYDQIAYMIAQGLTPAIEHEHPSNSRDHYWTMWKLPMFGEQDLNAVAAEIEACRRTYPDHHVRLIGYDNYTQSQGVCFVVHEGRA
ncbi:ribulose bisphosphate carboxylase small subunit [Thiosocius teredinicola]|uniref:ribulose bisphosphate carboxylase small subunit n=1 Tax=Thiosocius teredinicola TaxID=1973002 RepID=UPI000990EA0A